MANLKNISDADLQAELKRREELKKAGGRPKSLTAPDWSKIIKMFEAKMDEVENGEGHEDDDFDHYVYEEVATTLYGPNFFKWWNKVRS